MKVVTRKHVILTLLLIAVTASIPTIWELVKR